MISPHGERSYRCDESANEHATTRATGRSNEVQDGVSSSACRVGSVFATDEEAIAACPRDLDIRATAGKAIVWFLPYRRTQGVIEIPDKHQPQSVEAIVIHDNTGYALDPGVMVGVSRHDGEYFDYRGHRLCRVSRKALVLVNTEFSPEMEAA